MKPMLFVQSDDEPPKVLARGIPQEWGEHRSLPRQNRPLSEHQRHRLMVCKRWWLVECKTAREGRCFLMGRQFNDYAENRHRAPLAKVLAKGYGYSD